MSPMCGLTVTRRIPIVVGSVAKCGQSALDLKELNPEMDILILYRDMRMYGLLEDYYTRARNAGIIFAHFDPEPPSAKSRR